MDRATFIVLAVSGGAQTGVSIPSGTRVSVFRDRGCTCCEGWASAMKAVGYEVHLQDIDRAERLQRFRIPEQVAGCHTARIDRYLVEGHVPTDVVAKLLRDKPKIRGIALPGMPTGTPGMPGPKTPLHIVFIDNPSREFMPV